MHNDAVQYVGRGYNVSSVILPQTTELLIRRNTGPTVSGNVVGSRD